MNKHYDNFKDLTLTTEIKDCNDGWYAFNDTVFYAEKGGMLSDKGTINGQEVIGLKWVDDVVYHQVAEPLSNPIEMVVDAKERYINTSVQSALHILDGYYRKRGLELPAVGVNHDNQWFEVNTKDVDETHLKEVQDFMDEVIMSETPVEFTYMKGSEYSDPFYAKFDELRIVKFGDLDEQPCGTPHVNNTGEILNFTILDSEKTSRGTKVYFTCNFLSEERFQTEHQLINATAKAVSVPKRELLEKVTDLVTQNKALKKELDEVAKELCSYKAQAIIDSSETIIKSDIKSANLFRTLGQSLINKVNHNLLVYTIIDNQINFLILSNDNTAREIYKKNVDAIQGQGGGSGKMVNAKSGLSEEEFLKVFEF